MEGINAGGRALNRHTLIPTRSSPPLFPQVTALAVHAGRNLAVSSGTDGVICLWDLGSYTLLRQLEPHMERIYAVALSPDGERIISCGADMNLKVTEASSGRELVAMQSDDEPKCMDTDGRLWGGGGG